MKSKEKNTVKTDVKEVPIYKIKWLSDDEWNRLAYRNYLQRKYLTENGGF